MNPIVAYDQLGVLQLMTEPVLPAHEFLHAKAAEVTASRGSVPRISTCTSN